MFLERIMNKEQGMMKEEGKMQGSRLKVQETRDKGGTRRKGEKEEGNIEQGTRNDE